MCPKMKHRFTRHTNLTVVIQEALKTAGYPSSLEPVGLLHKDGRRPYGLTLTPWSRGRLLAWDFTCISRLAISSLNLGIRPGSSAASEAEAQKKNYYSDLLSTVIFEPIATETLGGIERKPIKFTKDLAGKIKNATGEKPAHKHLKQRLDLAVQRGNAGCFLEAFSLSGCIL